MTSQELRLELLQCVEGGSRQTMENLTKWFNTHVYEVGTSFERDLIREKYHPDFENALNADKERKCLLSILEKLNTSKLIHREFTSEYRAMTKCGYKVFVIK